MLEQHIMTKHLKYHVKCPFCAKKFTSVSVCNRHLKLNHNIENSSELDIKYEKEVASNLTSVAAQDSNFPYVYNLSFEGQKSFPHMTNVLSFKHDEIFGNHIVANCDIDVGKVVIATPPFADLEFFSSIDERCFHCGKIKNREFFSCPHCINTWFCSKRCSLDEIHASKCDATFNREDCYAVRLATQMIKIAFQKTPNVKALVDFCFGVLFFEKESRQCLPPFSNYGEILQLQSFTERSNIKKAHRVVEYLASLPEFDFLVNDNSFDFRRKLLHLALSHINTIPLNSFSVDEFSDNHVRCIVSIFDFMSRINHSCTPNLDTILDENGIMYCVVCHPIKSGEQVFIDYLGGERHSNVHERKKKIENIWKFNCNCSICHHAH